MKLYHFCGRFCAGGKENKRLNFQTQHYIRLLVVCSRCSHSLRRQINNMQCHFLRLLSGVQLFNVSMWSTSCLGQGDSWACSWICKHYIYILYVRFFLLTIHLLFIVNIMVCWGGKRIIFPMLDLTEDVFFSQQCTLYWHSTVCFLWHFKNSDGKCF